MMNAHNTHGFDLDLSADHGDNGELNAKQKVNEKIREFARDTAQGEVSRIEFLKFVATSYLDGNLEHVATKPNKKGVYPPAHEGHYAEFAIGLWNDSHARKLGKAEATAVAGSRKSELATIFKAVANRRDLLPRTQELANKLIDDTAKTEEPFKGKTYDFFLKVARAQIEQTNRFGRRVGLPDEEVVDALSGRADPKTEEQRVEAVANALEKLAKDFPGSAEIFAKSAKPLIDHLATLIAAREDDEDAAKIAAIQARRALRAN